MPNPGLDIALRPGDQIVVEEDTRSFTALGATGAQSRVPFETQTLSAIEAIATSAACHSAPPTRPACSCSATNRQRSPTQVLGRNDLLGDQRMVYVLDLTQPTGMFEARDFLIRDGDTVYVTEAPFVQWNKTLSAHHRHRRGCGSLGVRPRPAAARPCRPATTHEPAAGDRPGGFSSVTLAS